MSRQVSRSSRSYDHMASGKLAQAVHANDAAAARRALAAGANPNLRGPHGALNQTSLVDDAVEAGAHAVLAVLLEHGARLVPRKTQAVTMALSGTAVHAAARRLDEPALRLFEQHRRSGPLTPLDENLLPPLAHALRGASPRFLIQPRPEAAESALLERWLSSPKALREKAPGLATFAVLDAAVGSQPAAFLNRLLAAGFDPSVCPPQPSVFVNTVSRWAGLGVSAPHAATVKAWVEDWTVALARLGFPWPPDQNERPEAAALRAVYDAALLEQSLDAPAGSPSRRPRL